MHTSLSFGPWNCAEELKLYICRIETSQKGLQNNCLPMLPLAKLVFNNEKFFTTLFCFTTLFWVFLYFTKLLLLMGYFEPGLLLTSELPYPVEGGKKGRGRILLFYFIFLSFIFFFLHILAWTRCIFYGCM